MAGRAGRAGQAARAVLAVLLLAVAGARAGKYRGQNEVKKGQAFNVTCMVAINDDVSWTKDGKNLTKDLGPFTIDERKINDSVEATLTVQKAKSAHSGSYQCNRQHASEQHALRVASDAEVTGVYDELDGFVRYFDIHRTFNLTCNIKSTVQPIAVTWLKEGRPLSNSTDLKDRYHINTTNNVSTLIIKGAKEDDYGNYSCSMSDDPTAEAKFEARSNPYVRFDSTNYNVVQGQKIKVVCQVYGKPRPTITWLYNNGTGNTTLSDSDRIKLERSESGVEGAVLSLADAEHSDQGQYFCVAEPLAEGRTIVDALSTLRVKDKYAALWPFIGICAEVIILCAIILVYEKRRTKNPDMEDSDADHDQKKS